MLDLTDGTRPLQFDNYDYRPQQIRSSSTENRAWHSRARGV